MLLRNCNYRFGESVFVKQVRRWKNNVVLEKDSVNSCWSLFLDYKELTSGKKHENEVLFHATVHLILDIVAINVYMRSWIQRLWDQLMHDWYCQPMCIYINLYKKEISSTGKQRKKGYGLLIQGEGGHTLE